MKKYKVYFTDYPFDPMICEAHNYSEAQQVGFKYIKAWNLDATIDRIEEETD